MIPCLYASTEAKFDHNGIGKLADAQSCIVTEKRNGSFELEMVYPADGIHAEQLEEGNIILAKPSDTGRPQPFRIYKIATPIDGRLTVKARHISYQLNFITVSPFATTGCTGTLAGLGNHAASECPFEVWTDISSSASFRLSVPSSFRNCLGGIDGSVLDTFGGEYEWDRYTVKLHHHRGADHGVHIVYGKNLIDFKMEKNIESVITGVHPYWQNSETGEVTELPEKVVLVEQTCKETGKVRKIISRKCVGRDADVLLDMIGVKVGKDVRCIICETDFDHPFVQQELMMPILPIVRVKDIDTAIDLAVKAEHGNRHTAHMHSKNIDHLTRFAKAVETTIFVKNAPSYAGIGFGGEGHTTFTIAGPTGEGITSAKSFTRQRRCVMADSFRII